MQQKIFLLLTLLILIPISYALSNGGFETGDLSGWKSYCYSDQEKPSSCQQWLAIVGKGYANAGDYGLKISVPNNFSWTAAVIEPEQGFTDKDDTYTIDMLLSGGRNIYTGVIIELSDSNGSVTYRGNSFGSMKGEGIYFNMPRGSWWTYEFPFKEDYYAKYRRYPDEHRKLKITCYQDSDYCELWIDNVFGKSLCIDKDKDSYTNCGEIDCNDDDPLQYPGTTKITDMNIPWGTTGECKVQISKCDADGKYFVIQKKITPTEEICDGKDNDCNGIIDDADTDQDSINDCSADKCLGSRFDNLDTELYSQNLDFGPFEYGNKKSLVYDMQAAKGCTCRQIGELLDIDTSKGCSADIMQEWTGLSPKLDGNKLTGAAVVLPSNSKGFLKWISYAIIGILILIILFKKFSKKKEPEQPRQVAIWQHK